MPFPTPLLSLGFILSLILYLFLSAVQGNEEWRLESIHGNFWHCFLVSIFSCSSMGPSRSSNSSETECSTSNPFHRVTIPANKSPPAWTNLLHSLTGPARSLLLGFPLDIHLLPSGVLLWLQGDIFSPMGIHGLGSGGATAEPWASPLTAGESLLCADYNLLLLHLHYKFINIDAMICLVSDLISN